MCAAALEQAEFDAADFRAGAFLDDVGEHGGEAAELGMTEAVGGGGLGLGDERAVGVVDALGDSDHAVALLLIDALHVLQELVHIEVHFREIDEVGTGALVSGEGGGGGEPAGVAAHNLHDADEAGVIDAGVLVDLHAGSGDIFGGGGEAGAVVGAEEVVVDGLRNAHDAALIAVLQHELGDLVAGVHGVVAAVVEEVAHVVLFEDFEDALVVGVVHVGIGDLVAAGAEGGGRGVFQQFQFLRVLLAHVEQAVIQHALDAVLRAKDAGDVGVFQGGVDDAVGAGVDDGCRSAGLADDAGPFQFTHGNPPPRNRGSRRGASSL